MLTQLRPAKIKFYLRYMIKRGFSSRQVLEGTDISPHNLEDRHYLVETSKYIRIIHNVSRLSRSPTLAFELGEELMLGDLGLLGYCVMSCGNTDEATHLWHRYNPIFFGNLIEVFFEDNGDQLLMTYVPYTEIRPDLLQFLIEEKICYDMALQRLIGLEEFPMAHISLSYPEPAHVQRYVDLIQSPIRFSAERNTMLFRANAMAMTLQGRDHETHDHCMKLLNEVFDSVNAGSTLSHRVRAILHKNLRDLPGINAVAEQLCCTGRTLNRKLGKEAINFTDLTVAVRLEAIRNLLASTTLESKEIAERIGFSDVRSLRRFFKSHTGKTLQQFRIETGPEKDLFRVRPDQDRTLQTSSD